MKNLIKLVLVLMIATTVASCSSRKQIQENPGSVDSNISQGLSGDELSAMAQELKDKMASMGIQDSGRYNLNDPLSNKVIYFEYDSSSLDAESQLIVEAHAKYLSSTGGSTALEGHTDERGTREYNLALGERRAQAVRDIMGALGAQVNNVLSYGEEKPISAEFWENRRVEIVY